MLHRRGLSELGWEGPGWADWIKDCGSLGTAELRAESGMNMGH